MGSKVTLDVGDVRLVLELAEGFLANGLYSPWGHDELDTATQAYERVQAAVEAKTMKLHVANIEYGSEEYVVGVFSTERRAEEAAIQAVKDYHAAFKHDKSMMSDYMEPATCEFELDVYENVFAKRGAKHD